MILDNSANVRAQLLTLLKALPRGYVEMYVPKIMLYITSAMTHLSSEIRGDSTKFLTWLLGVNKDSLLRNGGWAKSLRGLVGVLGWGTAKDNGCISGVGAVKGKIKIQSVGVLREFLQAGLLDDHCTTRNLDGEEYEVWEVGMPHWTTPLHMLPTHPGHSNAFSYLGLFSRAQNGEGGGEGVEDLEARRRWLVEGPGRDTLESLRKGVEGLRREGGEVGRLGAKIMNILEDRLNEGVPEE